jgi:hypothetical protein
MEPKRIEMAAEQERGRNDAAVTDLQKDRDTFLQGLFKKGAQFTQELLTENARLHQKVAELESENAQLRGQIASDDAIRELLRKIDSLERERSMLLSQFEQAEAASVRWVDQYSEVESELANLANLYVASYQLHSSLDFHATSRQLKELLEQLVGARSFAIYVASSDHSHLDPVLAHGLSGLEPVLIQADDGGLGETFATGLPRIERGDLTRGSLENPLALVPMTVEQQVIGVLAIYATLPQKSRFLQVDYELFKLFGAHAGVALVCARLFAQAHKKVPDFDGLSQRDM